MAFLESEAAYVNENAQLYLPSRVGEVITVDQNLTDSQNFDYIVMFEDGKTAKVKESELTKLTKSHKEFLQYIYRGNEVLYFPTEQRVIVSKVDLVHYQVEVDFVEGGSTVVEIDKLKPLEERNRFGIVKEDRNFDDLLNIFFKHYKNQDDTYTVPKQLLINLLDHIFEEEQ